MSSIQDINITHTPNQVPRINELHQNPGPPLPARKDVPVRVQSDGMAMNTGQGKVPQGHDILQSLEKEKVSETAALSAAVPVAKSQLGQRSQSIHSSQLLQDAPEQSKEQFPKTLRRDRAASGGASAGWNPLRFIMPKTESAAAPTTPAPVDQGSIQIPVQDIHYIKHTKSHYDTALAYLHYKQKSQDLEDINHQLQYSIQEQASKNEDLKSKIEGQDSVVRKAQESAFAVVESSAPKAEDDAVIRSRLKSVTSRWKQFAKKWASRSFLESMKHPMADPLLNDFVDNGILADDGDHSGNFFFEDSNDSKAPGILLDAAIAWFVVEHLLEEPFTAAYSFTPPDIDPATTMKTLSGIYRYLLKGDEAAAHAWRSQTVSLLDPPGYQIRSTHTTKKDEARKRKNLYYRSLVTEFEKSGASSLYRVCSPDEMLERISQLSEIFRECGDAFSGLWAQKVALGSLGRGKFLKRPFDVQSQEFEAHAFHRLEEGDTELNGKPIQFIVEPALVAYGNEYGQGYKQYKVWTKAVVWMPSPATEVKRDH